MAMPFRVKKTKVRTIDGKTIYLVPSLYELETKLYLVICGRHQEIAEGTRFIVERHIDKIGEQNAYEHFSLRPTGSKKYWVKSYQTDRWNEVASQLQLVKSSLD